MIEQPADPKDPNNDKVPGFTYAWMIPYLARVGRRHGYAMAFHGSMGRDLDVIAVPWVENASSPQELLDELCRMTRGNLLEDGKMVEKIKEGGQTDKPHGRMAYNIIFPGAWHFIDISIMPRVPKT